MIHAHWGYQEGLMNQMQEEYQSNGINQPLLTVSEATNESIFQRVPSHQNELQPCRVPFKTNESSTPIVTYRVNESNGLRVSSSKN